MKLKVSNISLAGGESVKEISARIRGKLGFTNLMTLSFGRG